MNRLPLLASAILVSFTALAQPPARAPEAPIPGLIRLDTSAISLTLPPASGPAVEHEATGSTPAGPPPSDLLLHDFAFEGSPVDTSKIHLRLLAPGVYELTSVAYSIGNWTLRIRDIADYYGLGERFNSLNHSHTILKNASEDNAHAKGSATYKPVPFFMSTTGYGLWADTTAEATFDMNASSPTDILLTIPAEKLRLVLFTGPGFPQILERFTGLTQRAILPPYWAFAPWMGRDYHRNDADVLEDIDRTRALNLPASVILIDSPWTTSYNSYKFNPKQFEDAPATIKHLHDEGYKLVLWHTSWINSHSDTPKEKGFADKMLPHSELYDEAATSGYFVMQPDGSPWVGRWWKGEGSLIDFTNPVAKRWWLEQVGHAIQAGADGFKDDDAEGSFLGPSGSTDTVRFHDGSDTRLMRNRYALLYNNAMEELIQHDLHGNGVLFARSVTTGANGIGFLWGGDNESSFSPENGLPTVVTAGLGAGLSGMSLWTADLGGYLKTSSTPDPVVQMRWTEYSAFSPTMEILSQANTQPWDWDQHWDLHPADKPASIDSGLGSPQPTSTPALDTYRRFATLHMSLFPYRFAAAQQSAKTGLPIMRALVLDFQNDPQARLATDEYLFGPDLLVAPITSQNTRRPVYLPAGIWLNLFTGQPAPSGQTFLADAALDQIPVYIRAGAILPKIPEDVMTLVPQSESGNHQVKSLDDRRIYELYPYSTSASAGQGSSAFTTDLTDFEGRTLHRTSNSLAIHGDSAAHIILRWPFTHLTHATLDGKPLDLHSDPNGTTTAEFDHLKDSTLTWQ